MKKIILTGEDADDYLASLITPRDEPNKETSGNIIDLDADPFTPYNLTVESHKKGGVLAFDPDKIILHLEETQNTGYVKGEIMWEKWKDMNVLNANVLDYLLKNTHLIPESWKKDEEGRTRYIHFPGTCYRNSGGSLYVRYLYFDDGRWDWGYYWLGEGFDAQGPAAVLAS